MAYTLHGHHIPGTSYENPPADRARCNGPGLCPVCSADVSNSRKKISDYERILRKVNIALLESGLTIKQTADALISMQNNGITFNAPSD